MVRLVLFLKKIYVLLLFIILEVLCLHFYAVSTNYTKARLLTFSNSIMLGVYEGMSSVTSYFTLGRDNRMLTAQVAELRTQLAAFEADTMMRLLPEGDIVPYQYMAARVVNNSVTKQENFFTVDKGLLSDVDANMAVISADGAIAGYVVACSDKFAACISILNNKFRTSGRFLRGEWTGSVFWDGRSSQHVTLADIPRDATINKGDTIVTSDYSLIFPPGITIGTVVDWKVNDQTYSYEVRVKLACRISSLRNVVLVRYMDAAERSSLESSTGY